MYYIVPLGNAGLEYEKTRHNVGWIVMDRLTEKLSFPEAIKQKSASGRVTTGCMSGTEVAVLYPETMMNNSGSAVVKFVPKDDSSRLIVVYDDIDLPLGEVRVSFGRGAGGHNGVQSIIDKLGTKDFVRVRIGIGKTAFWPWQKSQPKRPQGAVLPRYVLSKFSKFELAVVEKSTATVEEILRVIVREGCSAAMNRFN